MRKGTRIAYARVVPPYGAAPLASFRQDASYWRASRRPTAVLLSWHRLVRRHTISGYGNTASLGHSTVAGGAHNTASGGGSAVGGGSTNTASGSGSTIGGGNTNTASNLFDTVGGGFVNVASGSRSTVAGGSDNTASGQWSTIPGGRNNIAAGDYSFAAGYFARANAPGCFVFADSSTDQFTTCPVANEFIVRALGGVYLFTGGTSDATYTGAYLNPGSSTWLTYSDRNGKENFAAVDARAVLDALAGLPISTWNWKTEDARIRHMGPVAQDFWAAFALGPSDRHITTVDADGVALAAIQGLNAKLEARLAEKDQQLTTQQREITELRERVAQVEALRGELAALRNAITAATRGATIAAQATATAP